MLGYFLPEEATFCLIQCFNHQATENIYEKSPNLLLLDVFFKHFVKAKSNLHTCEQWRLP